jgi:hypothetical protein
MNDGHEPLQLKWMPAYQGERREMMGPPVPFLYFRRHCGMRMRRIFEFHRPAPHAEAKKSTRGEIICPVCDHREIAPGNDG